MCRLPSTVIMANGSIETTEEAIVYVKDLDMFATVQLLVDTSQTPNLLKENKIVFCKCDNFVPIVVPSKLSDTNISSSAGDSSPNSYHPMIRIQRGHREDGCKIWQNGWKWLKNGGTKTNILWKSQQRSTRIISSGPSSIRQTKKARHYLFTHFLKAPNCELCKSAKITRIGWTLNQKRPHTPRDHDSHHKILNEQRESRNDQKYAIVVEDLATPWIQS